jgi:hypothetical protein
MTSRNFFNAKYLQEGYFRLAAASFMRQCPENSACEPVNRAAGSGSTRSIFSSQKRSATNAT